MTPTMDAIIQVASVLMARDYAGEALRTPASLNIAELSAEELGKNLGDDLAEGKPTLPLIYAMRTGSDAQRDVIRRAILDGGREQLHDIQEIIHATGALNYTARRARDAADAAIAVVGCLPDNEYRQALMSLAEFAIQRRS